MTSKIKLFNYIILSIVLTQLISCNVTKQIPKDKSLLANNTINILGVEKDLINDFFYKDELYTIPVQKPNKKTLGFKMSIGIWAFYDKKKITKFTQFMKTKIGNEPVLFDSSKLSASVQSFKNYYTNIGHFDKEVEVSYETKNQKTTVTYNITPRKPYVLNKIIYDSITDIEKLIVRNKEFSFLEPGEIFNSNNLKLERDRISDILNNNGYFTFNKEYVTYKIDSNKTKNEVDIYIKIAKETDTTNFEKYKIGRIYVLISHLNGGKKLNNPSVFNIDSIQFIQDSIKLYREEFLLNSLRIRGDSFYSKLLNTYTIQKLTDLNNFKLINSNFVLSPYRPNTLDAFYSLTPFTKQSMSFEANAYNSSQGLLGSSLSISYNNKNLTKRADRFKVTLSGGLELNFSLQKVNNAPSIISRSDISLKTTYTLDKFLLPILFSNKGEYLSNNTVFTNNFTYEKRIGYYNLFNLGTSAGYDWSKKSHFRHQYNPLSLNFIAIPEGSIDTFFKEILARNPYLKSAFSNVFILGSNYQFSFSKNSKNQKGIFGLKINLETAGNSIFILNKLVGNKDDNIKINGTEVSQYFKLLSEMVYSKKINKLSSFHTRLKAGIGLPYGNSNKLTYVKQFFIGGPYSLRAFPLRTIGPGSFNPNVNDINGDLLPKDQLGNLVIEGNYEYRFNIVKFIKGAVFADIGNVWNTSEVYHNNDKTVFKFDEFFKQFYIGSGFGLRFDFDYFVIRADMGIPIRVPYYNEADNWVIKDAKPFNSTWINQNLIFNIAVGYPF